MPPSTASPRPARGGGGSFPPSPPPPPDAFNHPATWDCFYSPTLPDSPLPPGTHSPSRPSPPGSPSSPNACEAGSSDASSGGGGVAGGRGGGSLVAPPSPSPSVATTASLTDDDQVYDWYSADEFLAATAARLLPPTARVVDVGCGTSAVLPLLVDDYGFGRRAGGTIATNGVMTDRTDALSAALPLPTIAAPVTAPSTTTVSAAGAGRGLPQLVGLDFSPVAVAAAARRGSRRGIATVVGDARSLYDTVGGGWDGLLDKGCLDCFVSGGKGEGGLGGGREGGPGGGSGGDGSGRAAQLAKAGGGAGGGGFEGGGGGGGGGVGTLTRRLADVRSYLRGVAAVLTPDGVWLLVAVSSADVVALIERGELILDAPPPDSEGEGGGGGRWGGRPRVAPAAWGDGAPPPAGTWNVPLVVSEVRAWREKHLYIVRRAPVNADGQRPPLQLVCEECGSAGPAASAPVTCGGCGARLQRFALS